MCGERFNFFGFKNTGRFSCFHIGLDKISSLNMPFRNGEKGVKYGTPKEDVVVIIARCKNIPIDIPRKPANAPQENIYKTQNTKTII